MVTCVGVEPNTKLAKSAGLVVSSNGVVVDAALETTSPGVFAAGDVIEFPDPVTGTAHNASHFDNAFRSGLLAGANMVMYIKQKDKTRRQYKQIPARWSHIGDINIESVGVCDPNYKTVGVYGTPPKQRVTDRGVIYYIKDKVCVMFVVMTTRLLQEFCC